MSKKLTITIMEDRWYGQAACWMSSHTSMSLQEADFVNVVRYRDEVLEPYVHLFMNAAGPDFILMDHNARHIKLIWLMNFRKVRIFPKRIGQLDLQISSI
ncbi:hypothetical protein TNCV_1164591 [Trichonephila clavipes]|nr:hypothetical protein TNCV_1164591 [Trichonephila clavipes]